MNHKTDIFQVNKTCYKNILISLAFIKITSSNDVYKHDHIFNDLFKIIPNWL